MGNIILLLTIVWLISGVLYARGLEGFSGIGVLILTLVTSFGFLIGVIVYKMTNKPLVSVVSTIVSIILVFIFLIIIY